MMWYWGYGVHWWGWLFGVLVMLAFWAGAAWLIVTLVRWGRDGIHAPHEPSHDRSPEDILARRFSLGEIDEEDYQRRLAVLRGGVQGPAGPPPPGSASPRPGPLSEASTQTGPPPHVRAGS
ncbi:MAG: SHOCT domain-containing protein [Actinomycetota bacterium]|nr:SHOCT domain-containing protein [Actinomycetota bacterium]